METSGYFSGHQRCADSNIISGIFRKYDLILRKAESFDKALSKFGEKRKRSPQKSHIAPDYTSARQAADGLIDDGLKDRDRQILVSSSFVDQRLDIRFGEDAAAGGDRIDRLIRFRQLIQPGGICVRRTAI